MKNYTTELSLIDFFKNDNKQYNIYTNIMKKYILHNPIKDNQYTFYLENVTSEQQLFTKQTKMV